MLPISEVGRGGEKRNEEKKREGEGWMKFEVVDKKGLTEVRSDCRENRFATLRKEKRSKRSQQQKEPTCLIIL